MISASSTVRAVKDQVSAGLGDEAAILHLRSGDYYSLNAVAARIWTLLQSPRTPREIRDTIVREYDVEPERCEEDLLALLDELAQADLIEVENLRAG